MKLPTANNSASNAENQEINIELGRLNYIINQPDPNQGWLVSAGEIIFGIKKTV